jgi:ABC-type nitrate/sulfonate/bicarbonate transport system substrate-binding protein
VRSTRGLLAAIAAALALTTAACGSGSGSATGANGTTTLRVASNSNTSALPLWVAVDKKLCQKHGLDIKFTKVENVGTLPPALKTSFDVVFVTPVQAITATAQGIPVTEIAGSSLDTQDNANSYLFVKNGSNVHDIQNLAGKTIGVLTEVGTLHYSTLLLLKQHGVDPASVHILQMDGPTMGDQLAAGRVDAVEAVRPFNATIKAKGGQSIGTPFSSLGNEISVIWWGANRQWAEAHPKVVKSYQSCLQDATQYISAHDADARQVLQRYTNLPADVAKNFELPQYDPSVRPDDIGKWLQAMKDLHLFNGDVDLSKLAFQPQ